MPSMSAMVRARWTTIYKGSALIQTTHSLETIFDEVTFIAGPPLAVVLSIALFPQAGLLVAALLLLIGVFAFVAQVSSEPQVNIPITSMHGTRSVIRQGNVSLLTLLLVAMGINCWYRRYCKRGFCCTNRKTSFG